MPLFSDKVPRADHWERIWIYRICGAALGIPLVALLASGDTLSLQVLLILGVLVVLWRAPSALLLLMVQAYLVMRERPARGGGDLLYAGSVTLLTLLIVILSERARTHRIAGDNFGRPARDYRLVGWLVARPVGLAVLALATAGTLLVLLPESETAARNYHLRPAELRGIVMGLLLMGVYLFTTMAMSEWSWRKLTPLQARIYFRAALVGWFGSDVKVAAGPAGRDRDSKPVEGKK